MRYTYTHSSRAYNANIWGLRKDPFVKEESKRILNIDIDDVDKIAVTGGKSDSLESIYKNVEVILGLVVRKMFNLNLRPLHLNKWVLDGQVIMVQV